VGETFLIRQNLDRKKEYFEKYVFSKFNTFLRLINQTKLKGEKNVVNL